MTRQALGSDAPRLGVVGFGRLVRAYYLPALRALGAARIVGVADTLAESRRAAAKLVRGVAVFPTHEALLRAIPLDGVLIASPPSMHLAAWRDALAHGVPAFVEKPLLLSTQLDELPAAPSAPRLMIDFNRRFWPTYARAGTLAQSGALGAPVALDFLLHVDVATWSSVTRHRAMREEGGVLHDLGGHAIDLACTVLGEEPVQVAAERATVAPPGERLRLRLTFPSGASAIADLAYGARTRERLVVTGPRERLFLAEPNAVLHRALPGTRFPSIWTRLRDVAALGYGVLRRSQTIGRASIREALAAFVHGVVTGEPFSPGYAAALRNAHWVAAAAASLEAGGAPRRPVHEGC